MKGPSGSGRTNGRRWTWWTFVVLEVLAVIAVPVVAFAGARALLDTRAGTFLTGPGPTDPGFQALVAPSPVRTVLERRDGQLTGITLLSRSGPDADGGAAVLVPAELTVEDQTLAQWAEGGDADVVDALSRVLRLDLGEPVVLDEDGWSSLLEDRTVTVRSPDPVLVDGRTRFPTGELALDGEDAADWLGLLGNQQPSALLFRRQLWWEALLAGDDGDASGDGTTAPVDGTATAGSSTSSPPTSTSSSTADPSTTGPAVDATAPAVTGDGDGPSEPADPGAGLAEGEPGTTIERIAAGGHVVELLPVGPVEGGGAGLALDVEAAEALLVEVVPFPAGGRPGDRLRVRVLDRTGEAELDAIARAVARAGGEVVVVGNAGAFDGGATEAVIADPARDEGARRLLERMGTGTVTLSPGSDDSVDVTLLAGRDLLGLVQG